MGCVSSSECSDTNAGREQARGNPLVVTDERIDFTTLSPSAAAALNVLSASSVVVDASQRAAPAPAGDSAAPNTRLHAGATTPAASHAISSRRDSWIAGTSPCTSPRAAAAVPSTPRRRLTPRVLAAARCSLPSPNETLRATDPAQHTVDAWIAECELPPPAEATTTTTTTATAGSADIIF